MAGKKDGEWSEYEFNQETGLYHSSRINKHGKKERRAWRPNTPPGYVESQQVPPQPEGLAEGMDGINLTTDGPDPQSDEVPAQGGRVFPPSSSNETPSLYVPTSPLATSSVPVQFAYPQVQSRDYASRHSMAQYDNTAPYVSMSIGYNSSPTNYRASNMSENPVSQYYNSTLQQHTNSNHGGQPPTGPANNVYDNQGGNQGGRRRVSHAGSNHGHSNHTTNGSSSQRPLSGDYKLRRSKDFKFGYMFKVLWSEPNGNGNGRNTDNQSDFTFFSKTQYEGKASYTSIRRFVVWKNYTGHSICLPILTYTRRGSDKPGIKPEHHAIIYMESKRHNRNPRNPPKASKGERHLPNTPVCVEPMAAGQKLDPESRLNYAKVYTVEHNLQVFFIGKIHKDSVKVFKDTYKRVQRDIDSPAVSMAEDVTGEEDNESGAEEGEDGTLPENKRFVY